MVNSRWIALYYPYADFRNSDFILRAALYYDEVYFLQPGFFIPPRSVLENIDGNFWPEINDELKLLFEVGIIRQVTTDILGVSRSWFPSPDFGSQVKDQENREILLANIKADIENPKLQKLSTQNGKLAWSFPNPQFVGFAAAGLLLDVSKDVGKSAEIECVTRYPEMFERHYKNLIITFPDAVEKRISTARWHGESIRVPFHVGETLMTNIALLAASRLSATPITDNPIHHQFLQCKMESLMSNPKLGEWLAEHEIVRQNQAQHLTREAIKIVLPDIKPLTSEKVLKIRSKCSEDLTRFRIEMAKLATKIESKPWESSFENEMCDIVNSEIRPTIESLSNELKKLEREFGLRIIEKSISTSPISIITTIFTGLPIEVSLAASVGVGALLQVLNYWQQKKIKKSNGFSYLFNLTN